MNGLSYSFRVRDRLCLRIDLFFTGVFTGVVLFLEEGDNGGSFTLLSGFSGEEPVEKEDGGGRGGGGAPGLEGVEGVDIVLERSKKNEPFLNK